jgi:hypothetical protein
MTRSQNEKQQIIRYVLNQFEYLMSKQTLQKKFTSTTQGKSIKFQVLREEQERTELENKLQRRWT